MTRYSSQKNWFITAFIAWITCLIAGCDPSEIDNLSDNNSSIATGKPVAIGLGNVSMLPKKTADNLLVASFNIQVFGTKKLGDAWIVQRLAEIVRQFDVIAIQEIRATDQRLLPAFVEFVNAGRGNYEYILGPRLGRTSSQEQYAFIYDRSRVLSHPNSSYTVEDGIPEGGTQQAGKAGIVDLLHREPLVGRFVANRSPNPFTFSLVNIHTDPDEVGAELNVLDDVFISVRNYEYSVNYEDDVILLGDLNQAPGKNSELERIPGLVPLITGVTTNVRESALYDNLFMDGSLTAEFTGRSGVLSMKEFLSLTTQDAERLSDHNPVWAEFSNTESPRQAQLANGIPRSQR